MQAVYVFLIILLFAGCSSSPERAGTAPQQTFTSRPISAETIFNIELDWEKNVKFFGYLDKTASSSASGGPLYAADAGVGGVIAQIALHAAISNSIQNKKKEDAQDQADKVLSKYIDIIESIDHSSLFQSLNSQENALPFKISKNIDNTSLISHEVILDLDPTFYLAPDEKSLMLLMDMRGYRSSSPDETIFEQSVKAISKPIASGDHQVFWKSGNPENFKITSNGLFREALLLLLEDLTKKEADKQIPQKTYKYLFGGKKRYERASLIRQSCERIYIRNLKGNIVALPKSSCRHLDSDPFEVKEI